jgi:hypothetical protein
MSVDGSYVSVAYKARIPEGKTLADTDGGVDVIPVYDRDHVYWAEKHIDSDRWRPSIHMPKWAARIWLEVTEVRAQRVQDISGQDVVAEGAKLVWGDRQTLGTDEEYARKLLFGQLWDSVNGPGAWERNDWVFAYSFREVGRG